MALRRLMQGISRIKPAIPAVEPTIMSTTAAKTVTNTSEISHRPSFVESKIDEFSASHDHTTAAVLRRIHNNNNLSLYHLSPEQLERISDSRREHIHAVDTVLSTLYSYENRQKAQLIKPGVLGALTDLIIRCEQPEIIANHIKRKAADWKYADNTINQLAYTPQTKYEALTTSQSEEWENALDHRTSLKPK